MKRYPGFAVVALLFLLLVLLGSWVYLDNYPWPFSVGESASAPQIAARDAAINVDIDPFASSGSTAAEDEGNQTDGPLETPTESIEGAEPTRRAIPPAPVDTKPAKPATAETTEEKTTVVAELTPGLAAIRGSDGKELGLDPFVVSTLTSPVERWRMVTSTLTRTGDLERAKFLGEYTGKKLAAEVLHSELKGEVIWPQLSEDEQTGLDDSLRQQAVVYIEKLPEFRAVVDKENTSFVLPLTEKLEKEYASSGLRLVVHSPAFEIIEGYESMLVKKDEGAIKLRLQLAPSITVTVDVTPAEAVASGVRVWLERRGDPAGPDYDDSLYMSAKVPPSGRLHFTVPEHYGEIRVAATGEAWHSGLPQVVRLREWRTLKADVALTMAPERCDRVTGSAFCEPHSTAEPLAIKAARLESTHFGTTVYTGSDATFDMYVPYDEAKVARQFIVTAAHMRPEALALERGGTSTPGVSGSAIGESVKIKMGWVGTVRIQLPKELSHTTVVSILGASPATGIEISGGRSPVIDVMWGYSVLTVMSGEGLETEYTNLYVDAEEWQTAFSDYASGKETTITARTFTDKFRKR